MQIKRLAALSLATILATTMLTGCPWDKEVGNLNDNSQIITDGNRPGHDTGDTDSGSDNEDDSSSVAVPDYTEVKDPSGNITGYNVSSPAGLQTWAEKVKNDKDLNCTLTKDIAVSNWTSVSGFTGIFDGAGHKISGLDAPLFSSVGDGTVQNVTLELTATFSGKGGVTENLMDGTIQNCTVTGGSIDGDDSNVGGIAGKVRAYLKTQKCLKDKKKTQKDSIIGSKGSDRMTIHRYEVTDAEWDIIEPMLPKHHMGRPQIKRTFVLTLTAFYGLPAAEPVGKTFRQDMDRIRLYTAAFAAGVMMVRWNVSFINWGWNVSFINWVRMQNLKS